MLGDLEETNAAAETAQRQLAAYAKAEIDRIITNLSTPSNPTRDWHFGVTGS